MNISWIVGLTSVFAGSLLSAASPLYEMNFEGLPEGAEPEGFLVIDGQFAVREFEGGRVFELPGTPLESFGFLFGPNFSFDESGRRFKLNLADGETKELPGVVVTARAQGSRQGRRFPTYSIGLCGVSGYKLRVAPMKRALELVRGDVTVASVNHEFVSGAWLRLKLEVREANGEWVASGKVWRENESEPADWQLKHSSSDRPNPGKASCWAAPFSGLPIRFDDLELQAIDN